MTTVYQHLINFTGAHGDTYGGTSHEYFEESSLFNSHN